MTENQSFAQPPALPAEENTLRRVSLAMLVLAVLAVTADLHYLLSVAPEMRAFLADLGSKLPATTKFVLSISPSVVWIATIVIWGVLLVKEFLVRPRTALAWNLFVLAGAFAWLWFTSIAMSAPFWMLNRSLHGLRS